MLINVNYFYYLSIFNRLSLKSISILLPKSIIFSTYKQTSHYHIVNDAIIIVYMLLNNYNYIYTMNINN